MTKKQRALKIIELLEQAYPDAKCSLDFNTPHELLIATRLSAQCTDKRVNMVTPELFGRFPTLESLANANVHDIEDIIKSCGLYKTKARDVVSLSGQLIENYGGIVPDTIEELTKLSGIGRKTANLIVGDIYGKPAIIADTHLIRISGRLGFTNTTDAAKVEQQLKKLLPAEYWTMYSHRIVWHGRAICTARKPSCESCPLNEHCPYPQKTKQA